MNRKFRLVMMVLLWMLFMPLVAVAQEAGAASGMPTGMALAILIVGLVLGAALTTLRAIAPLTKNTVDDKVLAVLTEAAPMIQRWMDPSDSAVPPTPGNPEGTA